MVEKAPKLEGRQMLLFLAPKPAKAEKAEKSAKAPREKREAAEPAPSTAKPSSTVAPAAEPSEK